MVKCARCAHIWLNPRPHVEEIGTIYPPTYYAYRFEEAFHPIAVKGKQILDGLKMRSILRHLDRAPASFLDIGCGTGRFLRYMDRRGVPRQRNYGLDLDRTTIGRLAAEGYQVACERVEECDMIPPGTLDLATMFHVNEHVDDPGAVVRRVATWLSPGGVFAIETPNVDSFDAHRFQRSYWGGYHFPRHWNLFSPETIGRLCKANGLTVLATKYQLGQSFWMFSLHHLLRYGSRPRPRLAQWFDPQKGLPALILFSAFDRVRASLGFKTSSMLVLARKPSGPPLTRVPAHRNHAS